MGHHASEGSIAAGRVDQCSNVLQVYERCLYCIPGGALQGGHCERFKHCPLPTFLERLHNGVTEEPVTLPMSCSVMLVYNHIVWHPVKTSERAYLVPPLVLDKERHGGSCAERVPRLHHLILTPNLIK